MKTITLLICCLVLAINPACAWKIGELFSGMSQNITPPGNYQDQAAGYYTGGGFSMRTKRASFQPISLTAPCLKTGGCSNLDLYLGSFSIIGGNELINMAKTMGTQAASYGFQLALKTFAPQIEQLLSKLRDLAMELNEFAVEDCRAVQSLFSAALPKDSAMYETVCKDLKRQGSGNDYFSAQKNCEDQDKARKVAETEQNAKNKEVLLDNFNLFVIAAQKAKIPSDMLEATMAIAGTLIVKDGKRTFKESFVYDEDTFNAHLKGGAASSYQCTDGTDRCLDVKTLSNNTISKEASYQGVAHKKLQDIQTKMISNTAFDAKEIDFLSSIGETFPIYNYLSLEVVSGLSILDKSSDLVAAYMVIHYMGRVIGEVRQSIQLLEGKQINDQHFKDYLSRLDRVQDILLEKYTALTKRASDTEKRAQHIENYHMAKFK